MSRSRIASFALCLVGVLAACLAFAGTASAATHPPAFRPQLTGPGAVRPLFAPAASSPAAGAQAEYSCSFAAYGSGIAPVTVSMTSEVQTPWPVNQPDEVTVANDAAITLPSAVSSQLTGIDSITAESQVTAKNATQSTIDLQGAAIASSPVTLTEIPAQVTAVGEVTFPAKGTTGSVALPAQTVTFTPFAGTTAKPVITCTTASTATDDSVTVGDASGPFYNCTATIAGAGSETSAGPVDMTFSSSGTKKTGDSVTITVASPDIASLVSQLNGVSAITQAAVSADLAVTGAQSGTLHLSKTVTDVTATTFSMSGSLKLTKAGTVKIDIPSKFGVALSASGTVVLDVSCSLVTQPAPVALTLTVAQGTSTSPSTCATPSPTTTVTVTETPTTTVTPTVTVTPTTENGVATVTPTVTVTPTTTVTPTVTVTPTTTSSPTPCASSTSGSGGTTEASGTPVGGADTGGGAAPGGDVALAIAGAALLLTGCGLVLRGGRRGVFARARSGWRRRLTRGR